MATNDIVILSLVGIFALSGLIGGFVKNTSRLASIAGGGIISFYLGGWVSNLLIEKIPEVNNFAISNDFGATLLLIASYIACFVVGFLILKLIFLSLKNILESNGVGKLINSVLGLVSGIFIGIIFADIYCWGLYAVSCVNVDCGTWVIADCRLGLEGFQTFAKLLIEFNLDAIHATFPRM